MARAIGPRLAEKGEGHFVFISSLSGKVGSPRSSLYSGTKFGLRGFAFGLREDMHPHGVGVSIVSPGFVREAGMFADAGIEAAAGDRDDDPGEGGRGGRARDRAQPQRDHGGAAAPALPAEIGYRHPEFAARVQRRGGAEQIADELAAGQADKR